MTTMSSEPSKTKFDIPFLDLRRNITADRALIAKAFGRVLDRSQFILGPEVTKFEAAFAHYNTSQFCVGVASGLDALTLMLEATGVGDGDDVIVPANTHIATWLAVTACGARIVPVDPDPLTFNLAAALVARAITVRTKAILAVHLFGHGADMRGLSELAAARGIWLLSDAAQAAGAHLDGRPVGGWGHASAFSFYPTKNLGALGDGGAVVTNDVDVAARLRALRNYGAERRDEYIKKGRNSRLDELQAAVLHDRLAILPELQQRRSAIAALYSDALQGLKSVILPASAAGHIHGWHLYTLRIQNGRRDLLRKSLGSLGIGTGIYYPIPPFRQQAYAVEARAYSPLPISDALAGEILSLPLHPYLSMCEAEYIARSVRSVVEAWG